MARDAVKRGALAKRRAVALIVAGGAVVVLALTSRWWLPALPTLFGAIDANSELIGAFADLTTIATFAMLLIGAFLAYVGLRGLHAGDNEQSAQRPVVADHGGRAAAVGDVDRGAVVVGDHNRVEVHAGVTYANPEVEAHSPDPAELEGAHRQLEALPLEDIAPRGGLPPRSVMGLRPNPNFVGRHGDLKRIAASLKTGGAAAIGEVTVAASGGLGGVGKTQLACEFVYRYGRFFHGVYWLDFGNPAGVPAQVAWCGGADAMDLHPLFHALPLEARVRAVVAAWQSGLPRLLVFDNCEEEDLLDEWLPSTGGSRVLVTSRRSRWDSSLGVTALPLDVLDHGDGVELLRKHRPDLPPDSPELNAIAAELGNLPLALDLAGRYLDQYRHEVTPAEYLAAVQRPELLEHPSLKEARGVSPTKHDLSVWRTFAVSYRRLDPSVQQDRLALRLLARAARLAPGESLPGDLLAWTLQSPEVGSDPPRPTTEFRDAIDRLKNLGLVEDLGDETFRMHRLVVAFALAATPDDGARAAVEAACTRAAMHAQRAGQPARLEALLPHVRFVTVAAEEHGDAMAANCYTALSLTLRELRAYDEALPYARRAWEISVELYEPDGAATLQRRSNMASILDHKGEKETAKALYWEVLEAQECSLESDDPDIAATCNNLGTMYRDEDLYHEVLPLYERALRIRKKAWENVPPERHRDRREAAYRVAESYSNMGALLLDLGRPRQAGPHLDSALSVLGGEFGQNHERNANTLVVRGAALRALGIYPDTMTSVQSALEIYGDVTTNVPPQAGRALSNLGSILAELAEDEGVYEEQRPQLREMAGNWLQLALGASERGYGEDHPTTGGLNQALGSVREAQGAAEDARVHRERAETCRRTNLERTDAEAADAINAAGRSLMGWGLYDEAQAYLERALEIRENVPGEWSFGASTSHFNLGILSQLRGRNERARPYLQRSLAIRANICGETYPATEMVRGNLRILDS